MGALLSTMAPRLVEPVAPAFPSAAPVPMLTAGRTVAADDAALHEQIQGILTERNFVAFHSVLAQRYGHRAALFIGVCLYWTQRNLLHKPASQGWFYMPVRQMTEVSTLTRAEQDTVRGKLREAGILHERKGRGAVLHYRIDLRQLAVALDVIDVPPDEQVSIERAWSWFGRSISFYRPLADLAGGNAASGLYLSYLLRQLRQSILARKGRMPQALHVDPRTAAHDLGLTPKVLRATREQMRRAGLITEQGPWTHVNLTAILACIQQQDIAPLPDKQARQPKAAAIPMQNIGPALRPLARPVALLPRPAPTTAPVSAIGRVAATPTNRNLLLQRALPLTALTAGKSATGQPTAGKWIAGGSAWTMTRLLIAGNPQPTPLALNQRAEGKSAQPVVTTSAQSSKPENGGQASSAQSSKLTAQSSKPAVPNPAIHINNDNNRNTTTTTTAREGRAVRAVDNFDPEPIACRRRSLDDPPQNRARQGQQEPDGLEDLVYPEGLARQLLPGIDDVLRQVPAGQRQGLLDELQGQMRIPGKTIHNPAGWLLALVRRMKQGAALPLAGSVAALRRQQEAVRQQIAKTAITPPVARQENTVPVYSDAAHEARERLRELSARVHREDAGRVRQ